MSQEYIASLSLGDQSSNPFLHASLAADITEPVTCVNLFWAAPSSVTGRGVWQYNYGTHRFLFEYFQRQFRRFRQGKQDRPLVLHTTALGM